MIKKLTLENWKSFRKADLYIDPITVLIGKNASGKSNIIDAFDFLSRIARNETFETAFNGSSNTLGIRGGTEWATLRNESEFSLKVVIDGDKNSDYLYDLTINSDQGLSLKNESMKLIAEKNGEGLQEIKVNSLLSNANYYEITKQNTEFYQTTWDRLPSWPIYRQKQVSCSGFNSLDSVGKAQVKTFELLQNIFVFNPIPSQMRNYSPLSKNLERDASNIAGVIAALPEPQKSSLENELCQYLSKIPEGDMQKVWAEPVGRLGRDAMLYCEEIWYQNQSPLTIDATGMSDGTLRFLGILTAMLIQPKESLIVIEEVDNGLHSSRAGLLLKMLQKIGNERKIDVVVTTHNPALLDELAPDFIPFVMVVHRNKDTGESQVTPLEDLDNLAKLLASGSLGKIAKQGLIENNLRYDLKTKV
jgi:predicted ATPase